MDNIDVVIDTEGVAVVTLARPEVLNALNVDLSQEFLTALEQLAANADVNALVITGRGRAFCAGADLTEVAATPPGNGGVGERVARVMQSHFNPMVERLYQFPKPTLCALNGIAAGGGAAIALCADIVIASTAAGLKFVQVQHLGIIADLGANWLLPRTVGRARAMAACLLGETIDAARMLEWGLALECIESDRLMPRTLELAASLAQVPAQAVTSTRRLIDDASQLSFSRLLEQERLAQRELCDLPVFVESATRFVSK